MPKQDTDTIMDFQNMQYPGRLYFGSRPTIKKSRRLSHAEFKKRHDGQEVTYSDEYGAFYQTSVKDEKPKK